MHNYDHEIACPEERAMFKFLWCDYFHDSEILSVQLEREKKSCVVMRLVSDRDELAEWTRFHGEYEKWKDYVAENHEKYVYILKFTHAVWLDRKQTGEWKSEFLNARFKESALLKKLQANSKRRLYHLRIHTSDGFVDIVFAGFEIRRLRGRVSYAYDILPPSQLNDFDLEMAAEEVYKGLPKDDFDRYLLMRRFYEVNHPELLRAIRTCMASGDPIEDAKIYAAHLLGKVGDRTDIPAMLNLMDEMERTMTKAGHYFLTVIQRRQNILDAIELIHYREERAESK